MGNLDNGRGCDDSDSEALGNAKFQTFCVGWVDVEEEGFVAFFSDQRNSQVFDRSGEVMGYGLERGA